MEREVAKWLHTQLGYNASADNTLSANCRGNLKSLWEFLMARHMAPENKRRIQQVLAKHRREQEAARRAPERQAEALQQKAYLQQLQQTAAALHRTLASLQMALDHNIQDATEQHGDQESHMQELRETQTQALQLQACTQRNQQLVPLLQSKLSKLRAILEIAQSRCQASAAVSSGRSQSVLHQVQQATSSIQQELEDALEAAAALQQASPATTTDTAQQDQAQGAGSALSSPGSAAARNSFGSSCWGELLSPAPLAGGALQQPGGRASVVCSFRPSEQLRSAALRLLPEPPPLLLTCSSTLAAQACQELSAALDEAERALQAAEQQQQESDSYQLPWVTKGLRSSACSAGSLGQGLGEQQGMQALEAKVQERQRTHLDLFGQTLTARADAAAADARLTLLLGSTPVLSGACGRGGGGWEWELASLWLRVERLRAEVAHLQQRKANFQVDVQCCEDAGQVLTSKWEEILAASSQESQLNNLLWQLVKDSHALSDALCRQQAEVRRLLGEQLGPSSTAALQAAQDGRDELQRELGVVGRLPVAALAVPQPVLHKQAMAMRGGSAASRHATLTRLQLAGQRLSQTGRPTTGAARGGPAAAAQTPVLLGKGLAGSRGACVDAAAVSALAAACAAVGAVAPAKCPAALLLEAAGACREVQQLQQQLALLGGVKGAAAATAEAGADSAQQLRHKLAALHEQQLGEVLPRLQELAEEAARSAEFAAREVSADISHLWEKPAQHLLPELKYEGKSCSEWLMEIQALNGRKRQLSAATTARHAPDAC